jgi:sensor histidine kinase YesM
LLKKFTPYQLLLISLVSAFFIMYPDVTWLPSQLEGHARSEWVIPISFFLLRYTFFAGLCWMLVKINLQKLDIKSFKKRLINSSLIAFACYIVYGIISFSIFAWVPHYGSLVLFQFFMVALLCSLFGHIVNLYTEQRNKEQQIEELTIKNLQSRYDALTNQINPHFFFNSLNGLTSLIRKKNDEMTLTYVNKLSDVFRYILQSDKKGLISLAEELDFVNAFRYMMEVRFANKLHYEINIEQNLLGYSLPVLSLLPLLDNIVVHNSIDRDHKMTVNISINGQHELVVSNPVYPKLAVPVTNGTGLENLENRFQLLKGKPIRVEDDGQVFSVYLPLN